MKKNKNELDVDFIGGQEPLTKDEEKAIGDFIKLQKDKRAKPGVKSKTRIVKSRVLSNA